MIRFSAALVVVAIGVLIAGVATSSLLLVYVAIGISAVALLVLAAGVALKRDELFRDDVRPASDVDGATAGQQAVLDHQPASSGPGSKAGESRVPVPAAGGAFGSPFSSGTAPGETVPEEIAPGGTSHREMRSPPGPAVACSGQRALRPRARRRALLPGRRHGLRQRPASPGHPRLRRPRRRPPRAAGPGVRPLRRRGRIPILPWSDSLPTRVNITKGNSPDPVPSWLEDVDDESASARPASAAGATPLAEPRARHHGRCARQR